MSEPPKVKVPKPTFKVEEAAHADAFLEYLRKTLLDNDMTIKVVLRPKAACAAFSGAYGPGLEGGEVDIPADFTIQAKDNIGKPLTHGEAAFEVEILGPDNKPVNPVITNNKDGTYAVQYVPLVAGRHKIAVKLSGAQVSGSPWSPEIDPPTPDPSKCTTEGPGMQAANVAIPAEIIVQARNRIGNPLKVGGHPFQLTVAGPHALAPSELKDNGNGTYTGSYTPLDYGKHNVRVHINEKDVKNSPATVVVEKNPSFADSVNSIAFGPGVEGGPNCNTAIPAVFTIQAVTSTGQKLTTGGSPFDVAVFDDEDEPVPVTLVDNKDGTYTGSYQPQRPTLHVVEVILRHHAQPLFFEHIKKSPFKVQVCPGIDASKCIAFGPGLEDGVVDTLPAKFKIQSRDVLGKDIKKGGSPFVVTVNGPEGDVPATIVDNNDGTYDVEYQPLADGDHKVEVTLEGKPVGKSPFHVDVKKGCFYGSSGIGSYTFIIQAKGKDGAPLAAGGERFEVVVNEEKGKVLEGVKVQDLGNGKYVVSYELPGTGHYLVSCMLNGRHIRGSPIKQIVP